MTFTELSTDLLADPVALLMSSFFTASNSSKAAGQAYIERLKLRVTDRDAPVSMMAAGAQLAAIREWGSISSADRYAMLPRIHQRILIVHGSKDIVVIPINAFLLAQHLQMLGSRCIRMPATERNRSTRKSFSSTHGYSWTGELLRSNFTFHCGGS